MRKSKKSDWHAIKNPDGYDLPPPHIRIECANVNGFRYFAERTRPSTLTYLLQKKDYQLDELISRKILAFWRFPHDDTEQLQGAD